MRLWLQLIVDTEIKLEERTHEPLLPNMTFKVRCGDSLVPRIGDLDLGQIKRSSLPTYLKGRLTNLKAEKRKYFFNDKTGKFRSEQEIFREEGNVFNAIIEYQIDNIRKQIQDINRQIEQPETEQLSLMGTTTEDKATQLNLLHTRLADAKHKLQQEIEQLRTMSLKLTNVAAIPFAWDIAFVEIFESDRHGFDIVIGNPPYVRQELIADPKKHKEDFSDAQWREHKRLYKTLLMESVYNCFPDYFRRKSNDKIIRVLDAKNDLYIYFYFHGLYLLNENGCFCFVTSNSWLDVGYGRDLQEFLLNRVPVHFIIDNQVKRTFKSSDVNTIICLFGNPQKKISPQQTAKFVMFRTPFENVLEPVIFEEIDTAQTIKTTPEYRVVVKSYPELFQGGTATEPIANGITPITISQSQTTLTYPRADYRGAYTGDKWGGKYLRAPDIYYTILEKGKGKFVRLGDIAEVRRGFTTGANEFFYLTQEQIDEWGIEEEFLKPVIISPRDCESIMINDGNKQKRVLICHQIKEEINSKNVIKYIQWGESKGFHLRPSTRSKSIWYEFPEKEWAKVLWPMIHNDRLNVFWNNNQIAVDHNLFEIVTDYPDEIWASLSWIGQVIFRELYGRFNLGEGALKTEGIDIKKLVVLNPLIIIDKRKLIDDIRKKMNSRNTYSVKQEANQKDRKALDDIVFDAIGLTQAERNEVYRAVCELVQQRLAKAGSV